MACCRIYIPVSILSLWLLILSFTNVFLERAWIFWVWPENGCEKWQFLVWNRVRIWRTRRHRPSKNSQETPGDYVTYDKSVETLATQARWIKIVTLIGIYTLKRSFVICQQIPTFLQKLNGWHMCSTQPSSAPNRRNENVTRDDGSPAYRGLATRRLYPTDFLEKIKRLLVVCSSIYIGRHHTRNLTTNTHLSIRRWKMILSKVPRRNVVLFWEYQVYNLTCSGMFNTTRKEERKKKKSLKLDYFCLSSLVQKCEPLAGFSIERVKMY